MLRTIINSSLVFTFFFMFGFINSSFAFDGYTKSISIDGNNNVEYSYEENKPKENEAYKDSCEDCEHNFIYVNPYQYSTWHHYPPRYNYNNYYYNPYYSRGQTIYTYTTTGFKTGPDGRTLTPLQQRDLYRHRPPIPPPKWEHHAHKPPHHMGYSPNNNFREPHRH